MSGNTLGERGWYAYTADDGTQYGYQTDVDLAAAVAAVPMTTGLPSFPRRFKPRVVLWEGTDDEDNVIRKEIICPLTTTTVYSSDTSSVLNVDGAPGYTTGRRGEKMSFPRYSVVEQ